MSSHKDDTAVKASYIDEEPSGTTSGNSSPVKMAHASPEIVEAPVDEEHQQETDDIVEAVDKSKRGYFAYFKTKEFYTVMLLGYVQLPHDP
jgi:hypothetical protein